MPHIVASGLIEIRAEQPDGLQIKEASHRAISIWAEEKERASDKKN